MNSTPDDEMKLDELMREVRRYLVAVDAFRAEGHEPRWLPEQACAPKGGPRRERLRVEAPPIL
jgi:hypothetical protein